MIPQNFEYSVPASLADALGLIAGGAKPLGGGMSLIPMMKLRLAGPEHLVNVGGLKELDYIREEGGALHIGAASTHYAVESSALVKAKAPLLAETASHIGDVQVRNMGTIGGSVAHNDPSADYPAALQALEAKVVLRSAKSTRTVGIDDFLVDTFTTSIEDGEIITEIVVPATSGGSNYQKVYQPASGFAIVGVAVQVTKANGKVASARIGVTGLSNRAYRAKAAEAALVGTAGSPADVAAAAAQVTDGIDANSDIHASAEYRKHLAVVRTSRALIAALA